MFATVLIANRGEIACRVIRTCRRLGIRSVAVYSDADRSARHVAAADVAVRIGPADARESYLKIDAIIAAARATGAEAIHPGYGFLAENAAFARACAEAGIAFVGPTVEAIETMGDKITARAAVERRDVPTVPGIARPGLTDAELIAASADIGFPILIKPSAGGGGKGMHRVDRAEDLPELLARARREAGASFGDDTLFLERFVTNPRHVEVQVLADTHGTVLHLNERECSLQRRHQKVIEEAPSPLLDAAARETITAAAVETARAVGYVGAGTVEFIVSGDEPDRPYFMEMNTRLQVEHPVTELITGVDLVEHQLRVAAGERLALQQGDIKIDGHAIEARVYAEDPAAGFLPTGGEVVAFRAPTGDGIRCDTGIGAGSVVSSNYDPMLAKVIAHGADRATALARLDRALAETRLFGVVTNVAFLRALLADADVRAARLDTELIDRGLEQLTRRETPADVVALAAVLRWADAWRGADGARSRWDQPDGWRLGAARGPRYRFDVDGREVAVAMQGRPDAGQVSVDDGEPRACWAQLDGDAARIGLDAREWRVPFAITEVDGRATVWLERDGTWAVTEHAVERAAHTADGVPTLESPMPGAVVNVAVADGDHVDVGQAVLSVEAMKMEHVIRATLPGVVRLQVAVGQQVTRGQVLARVERDEEEES